MTFAGVNVLQRRNVLGKLKYPTLGKIVRACLALPHGNADVERSFSINKNAVTDSCFKLDEQTINAIRTTKDGIKHSGGSATAIPVNQEMIKRARASNHHYKAYLEKQKKLEEEKNQVGNFL